MDPISATALTAAATAGTAAASTAAVGTGIAAGADLGASVLAGSAATAGSIGLPAAIATPAASFVGSGIADIAGAGSIGSSIAGAGAAAETSMAGIGGLNFARMFNVGSTILSSAGSLISGMGQAAEKKSEAAQLKQNAVARVAAGTQQMAIEARDTDYAVSKARNTAAAGGGGLDPSVMHIIGNLEQQGATNETNTLFNAQSDATAMTNQANADRFMANQYGTAGEIGAVTNLFSGINKSMAAKYGSDTSLYGSYG